MDKYFDDDENERFDLVGYLEKFEEEQVENDFPEEHKKTVYSEEHEKSIYSPEHFFDWERVTDKDCYTKVNYILYNKTHLATQELSKVLMNKYKKMLFAMQELKTIRRMYELTEVEYGWKIKITETFFHKKSDEINEHTKEVYFSSRTQQSFEKEEWDNESNLYNFENSLSFYFNKKSKYDGFNPHKEICIDTYEKLKMAKQYIECLENKLKRENSKDYDFEEALKQNEKEVEF